ncbi:ATP-binding protein [Streptomyces labedae]|uniref:Signal transduction histidine-protein kinase/phosphatase MprB n=1 Tax=Streptomyces labedae TaxID=285569 RepID=A0ABP6R6Z9_9ACTN
MRVDPSAEPRNALEQGNTPEPRNTPYARNTSDPGPDPGLAPLAGPRRLLRAVVSRIPLPLRGLRSRLLISFVLVAMASSLGTGALAFREARTGVLQQSQDSVINRFRASVEAVAPAVPHAPAASDLQWTVNQIIHDNRLSGWRVMATYGDRRAYAPTPRFTQPSPEMLRSVRTRRAAVFQRVNVDGSPRLLVGMPMTYTADEDQVQRLSGVVMYLEVPQTAEEGYVEAMVSGIERATLVALCLAVVLALLAASGVLRPVRALRGATRKMAAGRLDVRLQVTGSDELADLSRSFNETAAELERTVAELRRLEARGRRFVADVSHELRTPLAAMTAVTDVLDQRVEGETGEALRLVSEGTQRLSVLVEDLMEISRFDAGAARLNRDDIDLAESVRRTVASRWRPEEVELRLPAPGELRARVDPRRLDVVTANLVGNALRHGEPPVRVTLRGREDRAVLEVTDNGPGIAEEVLPHIFERFYKASTSRTRSGNGSGDGDSSGLGLAITAENVRLHGGRIHAANHPGGGAVFTVELPLDLDDERGAE